MRQPVRRTNRRRVAQPYSIPAPTLGWNARDSVADMGVGYAGLLKNFFPTSSDVILRKGSTDSVTGIVSEVETLASYRPPTSGHKLWAWASDSIFDVSTPGVVGAAAVTGLTNARWQTTNFSTAGGNFLLAFNGADDGRIYDGAVWAATAITGVAESTLINVAVHKERVWLVQKATLDAWYLATKSIAGAATKFPLGSVFRNGGELIAIGSWTMDGGTGPDDLIVFITSKGEAAVYQGTDPASAETWGLVGVYEIGRPIGHRCMLKFGGDLLILTINGVVPATRAFANSQTNQSIAYSDTIRGQLADVTKLYGANTGWQMTHFPEGDMVLVNIPVAVGAQEQYVMNSTTRAWCQFTEWPASCFEVHNNELYFGTTGEVVKAWTGTSDNSVNVTAEYIGAFDYFRNRTGLKHVRMLRPIIGWDSNPAEFLLGVDADFVTVTPTGAVSFVPGTGGLWDIGLWDDALWAGSAVYNKDWYSVTAVGYALAPHLLIRSSQAIVRFAAIDFIFERGDMI